MILSKKERTVLAKAFNGLTFTDGEYSFTVETTSYRDINEICDDVSLNGIDYYVVEVKCLVKNSNHETVRSTFGLMIKKDYLNYILNNKVKVYIDSFVVYISDSGKEVLNAL